MAEAQKTVKEQDKIFKCGPIGPGPAYKLPPVVGYPGHDATKWRYPAYTMSRKLAGLKESTAVPGPVYDPGKCNRFGKFYSPAFSLLKKIPIKPYSLGPGPAAYVEQGSVDPRKRSSPKAALKGRVIYPDKSIGPGPGAYYPKLPPSPAIKMKFRKSMDMSTIGPGPGAYPPPNLDKIKRRPQFTKMLSRPKPEKPKIGPGPDYLPRPYGRRVPAYSFGIKHSNCAGTYTQGEDT